MLRLVALLLFLSPVIWANEARVLVSIAPLHSLVSSMTLGITQPDLLLSSATSPHNFQLKPSQRRQIGQAGLIVWVGSGLETPLSRTLESPNLPVFSLNDYGQNISVLPFRSDTIDGIGDEHGHTDEGLDPHFWLDPRNAMAFVQSLLPRLVTLFPASETQLRANTADLLIALDALHTQWKSQLAPMRGQAILSAHDGFQYFEVAYDLRHAGAVQLNTDVSISIKRVAQLRALLESEAVTCVFSEPQLNTKQIAALLKGLPVGVATLDPMGQYLTPGPQLYQDMMQANIDAVVGCTH